MLAINYISCAVGLRKMQNTNSSFSFSRRRTVKLQSSWACIYIHDNRVREKASVVNKLSYTPQASFSYDALIGGHQLTIRLVAVQDISKFQQSPGLNHE